MKGEGDGVEGMGGKGWWGRDRRGEGGGEIEKRGDGGCGEGGKLVKKQEILELGRLLYYLYIKGACHKIFYY